MIPKQSEIREVIDVLSRTLPARAVHTLAGQEEPYADQLSLNDVESMFEKEPHSIRHIVRRAVFVLLRTYEFPPGELYFYCHQMLQDEQNPLVEPLRSMCRALPPLTTS